MTATASPEGLGPRLARLLPLAAAPAFLLMAAVSHGSSGPALICGGSAAASMPAMYLMMAVFHLPPWLRLHHRRQLRRNLL